MADIVEWVKKEFGISLMPYQEELLRKLWELCEAQRRGEKVISRKDIPVVRVIPGRAQGKTASLMIIDENPERRINEDEERGVQEKGETQ